MPVKEAPDYTRHLPTYTVSYNLQVVMIVLLGCQSFRTPIFPRFLYNLDQGFYGMCLFLTNASKKKMTSEKNHHPHMALNSSNPGVFLIKF